MADAMICKIDGCGKRADKRGWCGMHYRRWQRGGDIYAVPRPSPGSRISWLTKHATYCGDDCLKWPFPYEKSGYGKATFNGLNTTASRIMCELVNGPTPDEKFDAAHSCGNGHLGCLNPKHIRWASKKDNQNDRIHHGTSNRGIGRKLKAEDVREIRSLHGTDGPTSVGRKYGISKTAVMMIWNRKNWGCLE